jgi:2-polyprenyl-3-methyl-5-hydroxy-6-metoxy-1,4-benzoquinol methylase
MTASHRPYSAARAGHLTHSLRRLINPPGRILGPRIHTGDTVLDFGCGPGYFSLPMARMVGTTGTVIAVDAQEEMLGMVRVAAEKEALVPRFRFHRSRPGSLDLSMPPVVSFALAFHVLHETEDPRGILRDLYRVVSPAGLLLIAEPVGIVGGGAFRETVGIASEAGFRQVASPLILLSRSALLRKAAQGA